MSDMEDRIETLIARVVHFGYNSERSLKAACLVASKVVGTYSGATQEIARRTSRSVSSVENWAHAFRLYESLRKTSYFAAYALWRDLPTSHWWLAYDIQQAGYDALHYLSYAEAHSWSGRDMMAEYRRDRDAGNAPLQLSRAKRSFHGLALELMKQSKHLTQEQNAALSACVDAFGENK